MKTTTFSLLTYFIKNLVRLPIILVPVIFLSSCCQHAETYMVPEDFKQYFYFPAGSWWVYKNQFDEYDTLTITSEESKIVKEEDESCIQTGKITMRYHSSHSGDHDSYTIRMYEYFSLCSYTYSNSYFNELTHFGKNMNNENTVFGCSTEIYWWIQDTIEVNKKKYYAVYANKTTSKISSAITDYPILCYYKENIGLIQRELQNGEIWELVDYKINK